MAIRALRFLSRTVFIGFISCLGLGAAFAQAPEALPQGSVENKPESAVYKTEVSADFPGVSFHNENFPIGTTAAYRVNDHLKVFYRLAYHEERHDFTYWKRDGLSRINAYGPLVTDVFTHGPGVRLFPSAGGTFNISSGIDFAVLRGKAKWQASVQGPGPNDYRVEPVQMESTLHEARLQVFIGNAWELGRFRLTCDWFGVEKQFLVLSEKTSADNYTTSRSGVSGKHDNGLGGSRRTYMPVILRLSTGMAF